MPRAPLATSCLALLLITSQIWVKRPHTSPRLRPHPHVQFPSQFRFSSPSSSPPSAAPSPPTSIAFMLRLAASDAYPVLEGPGQASRGQAKPEGAAPGGTG
ncbi:hypothetical protein BP6252_01130 [Coleophoma cylindrospora]|uniref:Uncharacterized protein n=1 Tax=Coleophoma cylindrospora TaxID=1849047 RepID=A0A3D8STK0_9HELO|nr:hypothetical protein BP6252_01130 [Coleophoma cylindrospora]